MKFTTGGRNKDVEEDSESTSLVREEIVKMDDCIECEAIGRGYYDENLRKTFYLGVYVNGITIYRKNYVKIRSEVLCHFSFIEY